MKKTSLLRSTALAVSLLIGVPMAAHAARTWILPSATMLPGSESLVTIDGVVSDDLFSPGRAVALDNLLVIGPDGSIVPIEKPVDGKQRSSVEIRLPQKGTYRAALVTDNLMASYKVGNEIRRWRGSAEAFAKEVPADAQDLNVMRMQSRLETFVSAARPGNQIFKLKPTGIGLELIPITHPNDMFVGDTGSFRFLLDGKPAADLLVTVILGGNRYRDQLGEITLKTDQDGNFHIKWPGAGMYWLSANSGGGGQDAGGAQLVGTLAQPLRRLSYSATLEVLQP